MVQNRALEWCLAHQKRTREGKWEVDPNKPETARLVGRVMEYIEKEAQEEAEGRTPSGSESGVDALTKAMGKKDHGGFVKGFGRFGVGVGHQKAFGKVARRGRRSTKSGEEVEALKASLTEEFEVKQANLKKELEQQFEERLQEQVAIQVQAYLDSLSTLRMPSSNFGLHTPPQEPPIIEEVTKCRLAVNDDENEGNLLIVAEGRVHPTVGGVVHNSSLMPDHYRVSIDSPYEEHSMVSLPVPSADGVTKLGEAKDYFLQWPISLVLFEDKEVTLWNRKPQIQSKERVSRVDHGIQASGCGFEKMDIHSGNIEDLGEKCELLQVVLDDEKHDTIRVALKAPLFYLEQDRDIWVTSTDISEFIRGACANVSLIHVYILFLVEDVLSAFPGENITFLCPQRISGAECERSFSEVVHYVKLAFLSELEKAESHCKFVLAPYNENNHWILFVIDLRVGVAFTFDPLIQPRELRCQSVFEYAYRSYRAKLKGSALKNSSRNFVFKQMECAQQSGGTECGYYVMRYMYEILTRYRGCTGDLQKEYIGRSTGYGAEEMDEVREQWADFFRTKYLVR